MPPPALHLNRHFSHPQVFGDEFDEIEADVVGVEDSTATSHHVPEPEYQFVSDEVISGISRRSKEAMKEIRRIAEPFLGSNPDLQGPPPMELSPELIKTMGLDRLDRMVQKIGGGEMREQGKRPTPAQTMPAQNVAPQATPTLPINRGVKRKEHDGEDNNFQHVQLDVEKQDSRPKKQVKSVQHANLQNGNVALYHDAAYNAHQQDFSAPTGGLQPEYRYGPGFGGSALQGAQTYWDASNMSNGGGPSEEQDMFFNGDQFNQSGGPSYPQSYPPASLRTNWSEHQPLRQPYVASPYVSTPTAVPNAQPVDHQSTTGQRRSRADRGSRREMLEHTSNTPRFHPYANSRRGNAQSTEIPQVQQLDGGDQLQPAWSPVAQVEDPCVPDMIPSSSDDNPSSNDVPDLNLLLNLERVIVYVNDDPGQGIDVAGTQFARAWIVTGD